MKPAWLLLITIGALPLAALAVEPQPPAKTQTLTESWLQMQASNRQSSKIQQTATPKEREQSMQRWLDSYKYAIPDFYRWESVGSSDK
ncbi:DUF3613 domain-containing protein [Pseudomonas auratipiscis]|uniref:DUF3613 domain-containing protein n=1 Tax=Pseudomonas auratipiscis TaxID=3115853 RepID=A0AB35X632_9PSED|nr:MULTISPECIES: DUF3613 domain-containing protein [unclassified Pseudomonas]MEE1869689.1 DUF3613 domain-containing protein [Pseudomonas sp. 120P]MEE1960683.1 DUF3613 domain-containing protein [Pseudomonas sp. 119P]